MNSLGETFTQDEASAIARRMSFQAERDPACQQLVRLCVGCDEMSVDKPWMAMAIKKILATSMASHADHWHFAGSPPPTDSERVGMALLIEASETYLWSHRTADTALQCPLPRHTIAEGLMPYPTMFMVFENSLVVINDDHPEGTGESVDWILVSESRPDRIDLAWGASRERGVRQQPTGVFFHTIRYGQTYPDDLPPGGGMTGSVLRLLAFAASPYTMTERRKAPRQWRRGKGERCSDDSVNVVVLRRAAREAVGGHAAATREYRSRWWVSGHYRNQWYASQDRHRLIWIAPHLKGKEGAPLVDKVYAVCR